MKNSLSILFFFILYTSWSQKADIELTVDPSIADVGEIITITVKSNIQGQVEIDNLPSSFVHGYNVMNGMEQEMDHNTGEVITFFYLSQTGAFGKAGKYTIGPAYVKKGNKSYRSNKVTITIGDKTKMSSENVASEKLKEPAFGVIQSNKTKIFEGEPVLVSAKVYAKFNPSHLDGYRNYEMKGAIDKHGVGNPSRIVVEPDYFNGKEYYSFEYDKNVLFPTGVGTFKISPYSMNLNKGQKSFSFTSNHKTITVLPLPKNPPSDFIGAVGKFHVEREVEVDNLKQGDVFKMRIKVSGVGNLQNTLEPQPKLPSGFIVYGDPIITENISYCSHGAEGSIVYEYNIQVNKAGESKLNPTTISYFDVKQKKYISTSTDDVLISVQKNENFTISDHNSLAEESAKETDALTELRPSVKYINKNNFYATPFFWFSVGTPLFAGLIFLVLTKRREKTADQIAVKKQIKLKDTILNQKLAELQSLSETSDNSMFYSKFEAVINLAIERDMNLPGHRVLNRTEITSHLKENHSETLAGNVSDLLSECDQNRFGISLTNSNKNSLLKRLKEVINSLNA